TACLCTQRTLAQQSDTITAQRQAFDQRRQALAQLDADVTQQRPQVKVDDPASVAAFRQLLERRDAAQRAVDADPGTQLSALIEGYNQRVAAYNRDCTGHDYDAAVLASVQKNLSCPAE